MWYEFQREYGRRLHIVAETGGQGCTNTGFLKALFGNNALVIGAFYEDYFISGPDYFSFAVL